MWCRYFMGISLPRCWPRYRLVRVSYAPQGCDLNSFLAWLTEFRPTWYSAVPTMHQAILAEARRRRERTEECQLRFVRSSSAPLPPHVFAELEETFKTCVIESY